MVLPVGTALLPKQVIVLTICHVVKADKNQTASNRDLLQSTRTDPRWLPVPACSTFYVLLLPYECLSGTLQAC